MTPETDASQPAVELVERVLTRHWWQQRGMSAGSADICSCGVRTYPERGEADVDERRAQAVAAHVAVEIVRALGTEEASRYVVTYKNPDITDEFDSLEEGKVWASKWDDAIIMTRTVVTFPPIVSEWQEVE